ncbi:hypothetical protein GCM10008014_55240 [Paenibacillus silvae]|uniref:DUF1877 domain-containing protein n=1 Tax=Paenibacillus silvae TaxID=1325358 RepID=A0ABQ1ZLC3_9BACL|nr:DUF1877 family protein [Paenibacillus silvae]GGH70612.1 hypothetical protein GCM10008014_55240 [Paenibacillus silvae]
MGMSGRYVVVTDELVQSIQSGEISVHDCQVDLDIDKTWQMLQFTLNGSLLDGEPPLGYVVPLASEHYLGRYDDMDLFLLKHKQVLEAYMALEQLTPDDVRERYSLKNMLAEGVYPVMEGWEEEEIFQELIQTIDQIQALFQVTVENENGILFYVF